MSHAEQLASLFLGSTHKHGHSQLLGKSRVGDGKQETKNWTAEGPATVEHWEAHLKGTLGIGVIPIRRETSECRFGAIDIDIYNNNATLEEVNKRILDNNIPMVVCRSKSGGAHLFLFTSEWVPASLMREKLEMIAAFLGYANAEIFPAQAVLDNATADGNWINMPYFGENSLRYALRQDNSAMPVDEFLSYAQKTILSGASLDGYLLKGSAGEALFPDGPPCLEAIFTRVRTSLYRVERNTTLINAAVYANLRWPGKENDKVREEFIIKLNNFFSEKLPLAELTKTVLAQDKKGRPGEYKFQCQRCPLKDHCNSAVCRSRPYGIGKYNGTALRTLAKVDTEPPLWILTINDQRVHLQTDELFQFSKLQQRVMEVSNLLLPPMKTSEWQEVLKGLLKDVHILHTFEDNTEIGELVEKIHIYLYDRTRADFEGLEVDGMRTIVTGNVYKNAAYCYFLPSFLYDFLKLDRQKDKKKLVDHVLVEFFEAKETRPNIEPRRRCFVIPAKYAQEAPDFKTKK